MPPYFCGSLSLSLSVRRFTDVHISPTSSCTLLSCTARPHLQHFARNNSPSHLVVQSETRSFGIPLLVQTESVTKSCVARMSTPAVLAPHPWNYLQWCPFYFSAMAHVFSTLSLSTLEFSQTCMHKHWFILRQLSGRNRKNRKERLEHSAAQLGPCEDVFLVPHASEKKNSARVLELKSTDLRCHVPAPK